MVVVYFDLFGLIVWLVCLGVEIGGYYVFVLCLLFLVIGVLLLMLVVCIVMCWFGNVVGW